MLPPLDIFDKVLAVVATLVALYLSLEARRKRKFDSALALVQNAQASENRSFSPPSLGARIDRLKEDVAAIRREFREMVDEWKRFQEITEKIIDDAAKESSKKMGEANAIVLTLQTDVKYELKPQYIRIESLYNALHVKYGEVLEKCRLLDTSFRIHEAEHKKSSSRIRPDEDGTG